MLMCGVVRLFLKGTSWFGSSIFGKILAHAYYIHDCHLTYVISIGTEGIFLRLVPHGVVLTFSFDDKEETRVLTLRRRAFPSQRFYSSYTLTTLMWWSNVTCKTSKLLCLFLDKDVMSFRINISYSRKCAFLHVHIFSYNTAVGWELRRRNQRLGQFYKISLLWGDLFICNQVRFATHGKIKFLSADVESSAESRAGPWAKPRKQWLPASLL